MNNTKAAAEQDLAYGQSVIVTARWILVAAGLILILWNPGSLGQLRVQIIVVLLLAFTNFYLHTRLLTRKPIVSRVAYLTSLADLAVITIIVITQGGFSANAFVFYFPALVGMAVAFPGVATLLFAGGIIGFYTLVSLVSLLYAETPPFDNIAQVFIARLLMLAAVAFCGFLYRRIENDRRREAAQAQMALMEQVQHGKLEAPIGGE